MVEWLKNITGHLNKAATDVQTAHKNNPQKWADRLQAAHDSEKKAPPSLINNDPALSGTKQSAKTVGNVLARGVGYAPSGELQQAAAAGKDHRVLFIHGSKTSQLWGSFVRATTAPLVGAAGGAAVGTAIGGPAGTKLFAGIGAGAGAAITVYDLLNMNRHSTDRKVSGELLNRRGFGRLAQTVLNMPRIAKDFDPFHRKIRVPPEKAVALYVMMAAAASAHRKDIASPETGQFSKADLEDIRGIAMDAVKTRRFGRTRADDKQEKIIGKGIEIAMQSIDATNKKHGADYIRLDNDLLKSLRDNATISAMTALPEKATAEAAGDDRGSPRPSNRKLEVTNGAVPETV